MRKSLKINVIGVAWWPIFTLLMKLSNPEHVITIYERNKSDDTFGFGVVFSDETLEILWGRIPRPIRKSVMHCLLERD